MKYFTVFVMLLAASPCINAASADEGVIQELYVENGGSIAVKLEGGFPNSIAANECSSASGWAGALTPDPVVKSALLMAKASRAPVSLSISGCEAGGGWLKLNAVYVK